MTDLLHDQAPKAQVDPQDHEPTQASIDHQSQSDDQVDTRSSFLKKRLVRGLTAGAGVLLVAGIAKSTIFSGGQEARLAPEHLNPEVSNSSTETQDMPGLYGGTIPELPKPYTGPEVLDIPTALMQDPITFVSLSHEQQTQAVVPYFAAHRAESLQKYKEIAARNGHPVTEPSSQPTERLQIAQEELNNIRADLITASGSSSNTNVTENLLSKVYGPNSAMYQNNFLPHVADSTLNSAVIENMTDQRVVDVSDDYSDGHINGDLYADGYKTQIVKLSGGGELILTKFSDPTSGAEHAEISAALAEKSSGYIASDDFSQWHP